MASDDDDPCAPYKVYEDDECKAINAAIPGAAASSGTAWRAGCYKD